MPEYEPGRNSSQEIRENESRKSITRLELIRIKLQTPNIFIEKKDDTKMKVPKTNALALALWEQGFRFTGALTFNESGDQIDSSIFFGDFVFDDLQTAIAAIYSVIPEEYKS